MPNKLKEAGISWVVIGSQTKPYKPPKIEWVQEIVEACDKAKIPVFLKNNLWPLLANEAPFGTLIRGNSVDVAIKPTLRQEMPEYKEV